MKCENIKLLLMDFFYEEISEKEKTILQQHLQDCAICRQEFQTLKETSSILKKWENVNPDMNFVFVTEKNTIWQKLKEIFSFPPKKVAYGFVFGFVSILLLLAVMNTEIKYENGNFSLRMSIFPTKSEPQRDKLDEDLITQLQTQNIQLMNHLIQQSERRQQEQFLSTLARLSRDMETRRINDLQLVGVGLDEIEKSIYSKIERRTNNQLSSLMRYINAQQQNK